MKGRVIKYRNFWAGVIELGRDPETGKRLQKWVYGSTEEECQKKLNILIYELQENIYEEPTDMSVSDFMDLWLANYAENNLAPSTYRSYKEIVKNHISPRIGKIHIDKLKPFQIQKMYTNLGKTKLSPTTILYIHRVLHKALSQGVKWEIIGSNPAAKADPPKKRKIQYNLWDNSDIARAVELAKDTLFYIPILLATTTGLRAGEICGLQWNNIDLDRCQLSILYTYQRIDSEWKLKNVKTEKGNRPVVIPEAIVDILKQHKTWQKKNQMFFGEEYQYNTHVTTWPDGRPITTEYISKSFPKFIKENNLPKIRFHDLRHTHATELLKAGIHPKIVSERLGHSGIRITLDTYSHVIPSLQKEAAEISANNIFGTSTDELEKKNT